MHAMARGSGVTCVSLCCLPHFVGAVDFRANGRAECDLFIALCQWVEEDGLLSGAGRKCGLQAAESMRRTAGVCKYCALRRNC